MLERNKVRRWQWISISGVVFLMMLAGAAGGIISRRFDAERIQTRNTNFANEVVLSDKGLTFKSKEGRVIAKLDSDQTGGFLIIYNASERPAMSIGGSVSGGGLIGLTNGKGVGDILRLTGDESGASLFLLSTHGKRGIELSTDDDGGNLSVNGPTGDPAVVVTTSASQKQVSGKIDIYESIAGKLLWNAPAHSLRRAP